MFVSLNGALTAGKNVAWPEFAQLAARAGYCGVDWSLPPAKAAGVDATKALFADLKIQPTIVNLPVAAPFAGDAPAFDQKLRALADDAAFTAAVGCRKMMVVLPASTTLPVIEYRALVRERMRAAAEILRRSNIQLGLEFLGPLYMRGGAPNPCPARPGATAVAAPSTTPQSFIWTLPETVALAKECGANVGAILDAWHWHHSGGSTAEIVAAGKSRIVHIHVSDARRVAPETVCDSPRLMPGEGVIDLAGFFQALKTIGYEDGVSPEPLGRIPADMTADDAARLGLETTTAVMKRADVI